MPAALFYHRFFNARVAQRSLALAFARACAAPLALLGRFLHLDSRLLRG
jgi:hypothetical protein